jgi:maleylacetoacetate isomerase
MKLYNYFRSSASFRVRVALNLKGLSYDYLALHLRKAEDKQRLKQINPQALVPILVDGENKLIQSLAIMEYLDETYPNPPLLPKTPPERARVRALALIVACEIHPLNNLRVLGYLTTTLGVAEEAKNTWYQHWVALGLQAFEAQVAGNPHTGKFCHGDTPGLADCCLYPQLGNARRFECDLSAYPTLLRIEKNCNALAAFTDAAPSRQPDAE